MQLLLASISIYQLEVCLPLFSHVFYCVFWFRTPGLLPLRASPAIRHHAFNPKALPKPAAWKNCQRSEKSLRSHSLPPGFPKPSLLIARKRQPFRLACFVAWLLRIVDNKDAWLRTKEKLKEQIGKKSSRVSTHVKMVKFTLAFRWQWNLLKSVLKT